MRTFLCTFLCTFLVFNIAAEHVWGTEAKVHWEMRGRPGHDELFDGLYSECIGIVRSMSVC